MNRRSATQLREDALAIWKVGVQAVAGHRLVQDSVFVDGQFLVAGDVEIDLAKFRRIKVVGGGKAAASMATGLEAVLAPIADRFQLSGMVNVPETSLQEGVDLSTAHILDGLSPASGEIEYIDRIVVRPAAANYPTQLAVTHTNKMLKWSAEMEQQDLCICLVSGGGSALLCSPIGDITFKDKIALAKVLQAEGADIRQLNTVRQAISRVKGGGLLRRCKAGYLLTLVISDIMGDPLELIASGPTVGDYRNQGEKSAEALEILRSYDPDQQKIPRSIYLALEKACSDPMNGNIEFTPEKISITETHIELIGNNAVALDAAGIEAEKLGYHHAMTTDPVDGLLSEANEMGRHQLEILKKMKKNSGPDCWISGGEPVVEMDSPRPDSLGGRNTQLALSALVQSTQIPDQDSSSFGGESENPLDGICFLSGGTDGEDGPTPAAGAMIESDVLVKAKRLGLDSQQYLGANDAFGFFRQVGGWIYSGPTSTNVCDLRVGLVDRIESAEQRSE